MGALKWMSIHKQNPYEYVINAMKYSQTQIFVSNVTLTQ